MRLRTIVSDIEEVAESYREAYTEENGQWVLSIEGPAPVGYATAEDFSSIKSKHEDSRSRNIEFLKQAAEIANVEEARDLGPVRAVVDQYKGVDVNEYNQLKANAEKMEKKGVKQPDDIGAIVREQVMSAVEPLKEELERERAARREAQKKNESSQIRTELSSAFLKAGGRPKALDFLVGQAESVFEVVEGAVIARPGNYSNKRAGEPISVDEYIEIQTKEADFIFGDSGGGGAAPGQPAADSLPPGTKVLRNPTPQELGKHSEAIRKGDIRVISS